MQTNHLPIFLLLCCILCIPALSLGQGPATLEEEVLALTERYDSLWLKGSKTVVFTGSSSIRLWNLQATVKGAQLINTGFGGSQVKDLNRHRFPLIEKFNPFLVVIYEGDNDLASGLSAGRVFKRMKKLCKNLQRDNPDLRIVLMAAKPSPKRWHLRSEFEVYNRKMARLGQKHPRLLFIDSWTPLLTAQGTLRSELYRDDGLHLNLQGYAIWNALLKKNAIL